ncbi:UNVERIFIED_CONTAM: hypothetical protein HDU68_006042 [Siphonaria sp. JEL0065]|nr:hypothetical protein HDU68_006042 [Siphonaria sp. JEL0065]
MQIKSLLVFAALAAAAVDPSTPSVGQQNRYRALPRGSNLAIVPVDGAEFLAGQKFDISVELHSENGIAPDLSTLSFTINGKQVKDVIVEAGSPYTSNYNSTYYANQKAFVAAQKTTFAVARASWRGLSLPASGDYNIELSVGSEKVKAKWVVRGSSTRKAKNALLFIGDGMAPTMISAARYISKNTKFGKFANGDGFLEMEKWDAMGKIATNGLDAIITDSANSAAAYTSGQKGWVNTLSVYADTTLGDQLDDAKVETITEVIRRVRPGMCIGVVSTASIVDATPASMWGHTRSRGQGDILVDQALNGFKHWVQTNSTTNTWVQKGEPMPWGPAVKPDVLLGGGGEWFTGNKALNRTDYYAAYAAAGYNVVYDKTALNAVSSGPVLGIFTAGHMDTWYEREFNTGGLLTNTDSGPKLDKTTATNQPGLEAMTLKAIEIMEKKCTDGWFLMSEAASIDKSMHPMDYDRGLADLLEFDRTLKAVRSHTCAKDTAIFLTADHSQGYDVYGSVDLNFFRSAANDDSVGVDGNANLANPGTWHAEQRNAIGVYQDAGWVDNVLDSNGLPTKFSDARYRLAGGKVDMPTHVENYEFKAPAAGFNPLARNPSMPAPKVNGSQVIRDTVVYIADPRDSPLGLPRPGNLPANSGASVHTLQAVDLYCFGPGVASCSKQMDNTELFFLIADILGLGDKADAPYTPSAPANADKYNTYTAPANAVYNAPGSNAPKNLYSSAGMVGFSAVLVAAAALLL